jgi:hypothetical protein
MKSFYKNCEVEVTAVYELPAEERLTPRVEIHCENITKPHLLTTKKSFKSNEIASARPLS